MVQIPVGEPIEIHIEEPSGSLADLAGDGPASEVARRFPSCLAAWADLGEAALDGGRPVDAYAYFRVGYHRGLDRLRGAGWRGEGSVPWAHEGNRGFLRSLRGLRDAAAAIGEEDEAERCREFLRQLASDAPER